MRRWMPLLAAVLVGSVILAGCGSKEPPSDAKRLRIVASHVGRDRIVASFFPVAHFARQVAGNRADVVTVVPSGLEPHGYEPSAHDLTLIYDSPIFIYNGAGLEPWADKIRLDLESNGIRVLRLSDSVDLLSGVSGEVVREENQSDPHIWVDPVLAQGMVLRIRDLLIQADPNGEGDYVANAEQALKVLRDLDREFATGLSECAKETVILSHAAFQYLGKRYGFKTLSISGLSEEDEPSLKDFAELMAKSKRQGIRFIFFDSKSNPKLARTLADEIGGETLDLYHIDGGFTSEELSNPNLYEDQMRMNLENLRKAMDCK